MPDSSAQKVIMAAGRDGPLATAIAFRRLGGFVAVVVASFWIKLSEEEKLMRQQFPEQYRSYEQRVKRIIPFVL